MKVFNRTDGFIDKVNFVDENNVVVGYDMSQNCCEDADWYITDKQPTSVERDGVHHQEYDLEPYRFYTSDYDAISDDSLDQGGAVYFKLVPVLPDLPILYLVLYNAHNGYYCHGFTIEKGGVHVLRENL